MQTVLGLVKHDRLRAIQNVRRNLFSPMGGETVHDQRVRFRQAHRLGIDLIGGERLATDRPFRLLAHARPHIGIDRVRLTHGLGYGMSDRNPRTGLARLLQDSPVRLISGRAGQHETKRQFRRGV